MNFPEVDVACTTVAVVEVCVERVKRNVREELGMLCVKYHTEYVDILERIEELIVLRRLQWKLFESQALS